MGAFRQATGPGCPGAGVMTWHALKTWPEFFQPLWEGRKTFELRINDRDFKEGDILDLREFQPLLPTPSRPEPGRYTGRQVRVIVSHVLDPSKTGLPRYIMNEDYVILSIRVLDQKEKHEGPPQKMEA